MRLKIIMKNTLIAIGFLLLFSVTSFAQSDDSEVRCGLPFDTYSYSISLNDEKAHLVNFAYYLKQNPEWIGYIFIMTNENETKNIEEARRHAGRIIKYLTRRIETDLKIEKSRLVIVYRPTLNESGIILQPVTKGFPVPNF